MDVRVSKGHVKVINVNGSAIQQSPQEDKVRDEGFENPRSLRFHQRKFRGGLRWAYEHRLITGTHKLEQVSISGALSRNRQTRRKAWAQSHGSELVSDRRVAEGQNH